MPTIVTILHFNDVYNIDSRDIEPVGGARKFVYAMKSFANLNPMILFSGDIFSPSLISAFTKGKHMSHILNAVATQCAVFGNHDFDFGLEVLADRIRETNFPWLSSNAIYNKTGRPLGDGKITHVIEWNGKRFGMIGLLEEEWVKSLGPISEHTTVTDFVQVARKLSSELKKQGCDYVIALTHMRTKNDRILAESDTQIDLILGGHDHDYEIIKVNNKYIIKSGTDFRQFSKISLEFRNSSCVVNVEKINIVKSIPDDEGIKKLLQEYTDPIMSKMNEVLGTISIPLEGRFVKIRTEESNLCNWICDILRKASEADVAILSAGSFRSNQIHAPGVFTLGNLMCILPFFARTGVIEAKGIGETILQALENGVSNYPVSTPRFPQVSGISFTFDPNAPPGQRIDPFLVKVCGEYLKLERHYKVALGSFLYNGKDGYTMFLKCKKLTELKLGSELINLVQNHCHTVRTGRVAKTRSDFDSSVMLMNQKPSHEKSSQHESHLEIPSVEGRIIKLTPEIKEILYEERKNTSLEVVAKN